MSEKYGQKWTREETILAFDLYCKIPFGKITKSNPDINALAGLLGRTPSSVVMKMCNLAHFDPELHVRNVNGMANASKLDRQVTEEFRGDWEGLSWQAQEIKAGYLHRQAETPDLTAPKVVFADDLTFPEGLDVEMVSKMRLGQYFFRMAVLSAYGNTCCITGMQVPALLIASHIKPWRDSDAKTERANPQNGLCLNVLHDRAFAHGLITVDQEYRVVFSRYLSEVRMDERTRAWFFSYEGETIQLPEKFLPGKEFLEYHNDVIFQG